MLGGPFVGEGLDCLGEAVCGAACQDDLGAVLVGDEGVQVLACELADEVVERRVSLRLTILQRRHQVDLVQRVGRVRVVGHKQARSRWLIMLALALAIRDAQFFETCGGRVVGGRVEGLVGRGLPSVGVGDSGFEGVVGEVLVVW